MERIRIWGHAYSLLFARRTTSRHNAWTCDSGIEPLYIYIYMYIYIYINNTNVCMHTYIYIYIHTHSALTSEPEALN